MINNYLKLNDDKTEFLLIGSKCNINKVPSVLLNVNNVTVSNSSVVRNLGAMFDTEMSMEKFVISKCKSAMYHLRSISQIRHYLDADATKTLIHALVTSRLDYANSLLIGVNKSLIHRLQLVQNAAARLITRTSFRNHITPVLYQLHWLPVEYRIRFKVLVLCFKCLSGSAPDYLTNLVQTYRPSRTLRSSTAHFLNVPKSSNKFGDRSFRVSAPNAWNQLPLTIRTCTSLSTFKRNLKTFLFHQAFSDLC